MQIVIGGIFGEHFMKSIFHIAALWFSIAAAANADDLETLLDAAAPGDVIETGPADFGAVSLRNYDFSPAVTIKFHPDSQLSALTLRDVRGVHFEGLTVAAGETTSPKSAKAVYILRGGDLAFRDAQIAWSADRDPLNDGSGLFADSVSGLVVENSLLHDVRNGVVVTSANDVTVTGSRVSNILADGITVSGTTNMLIKDNLCVDFAPRGTTGVHPDCIQLQAGSRAIANDNIRIIDNVSLRGFGDTAQGIFVKSKYAGIPHRDILIENNLVKQSVTLGIYGENVDGLTIRGNRVLSSPDAETPPRILVRDPSMSVVIENNTAWRIVAPAHATVENNIALEDED
jgi:hypothetical protein